MLKRTFEIGNFIVCALLLVTVGGARSAIAKPFWAQVPKINVTLQNLDWEDIAAEAYEQPAATAAVLPGAVPTNEIHVFLRDANKCLLHYEGTDRGKDFAPLAVPVACDSATDGPMAAITWDSLGRIDLFWFSGTVGKPGTHASLMHRWTDGSNWYSENLGMTATTPVSTAAVPTLAAAPTVASWGSGRLDVFWRDTGNQIRWLGFDRSKKGTAGFTSGGWFDKERVVESNVTGNPAAVERATNIIDLFWTNASGSLEHEYTGNGGSSWSGIQQLNVAANTAPSATTWGEKRIDVVYGVDTYTLGHLWIDGGTGSWNPSSEKLVSSSQPVGAIAAVEECGAPMVSIAGGEPLIPAGEDLPDRGRAGGAQEVRLFLHQRAADAQEDGQFHPVAVLRVGGAPGRAAGAPDASVDHAGTFDEAVAAIKEAQRRGFRVTTNTTFFNTDTPQTVREVLDFLNDDLRVDQMMISPAYAYWKAPDQEHFLGAEQTRELFGRRSPAGAASARSSTTRRCSWTSWKARPTSPAPPGGSPATRCSAGSGPAT